MSKGGKRGQGRRLEVWKELWKGGKSGTQASPGREGGDRVGTGKGKERKKKEELVESQWNCSSARAPCRSGNGVIGSPSLSANTLASLSRLALRPPFEKAHRSLQRAIIDKGTRGATGIELSKEETDREEGGEELRNSERSYDAVQRPCAERATRKTTEFDERSATAPTFPPDD